jgi:hypothetical protein
VNLGRITVEQPDQKDDEQNQHGSKKEGEKLYLLLMR